MISQIVIFIYNFQISRFSIFFIHFIYLLNSFKYRECEYSRKIALILFSFISIYISFQYDNNFISSFEFLTVLFIFLDVEKIKFYSFFFYFFNDNRFLIKTNFIF